VTYVKFFLEVTVVIICPGHQTI